MQRNKENKIYILCKMFVNVQYWINVCKYFVDNIVKDLVFGIQNIFVKNIDYKLVKIIVIIWFEIVVVQDLLYF